MLLVGWPERPPTAAGLRLRVDVSDDDAEYNRPRSNAKVS
jgi:hypothetical protein